MSYIIFKLTWHDLSYIYLFQARSSDNSQEGLLDQDTAPNFALLCPPIVQNQSSYAPNVPSPSSYPSVVQNQGASASRLGSSTVLGQIKRQEFFKRGVPHQPNSLDSVDGEPLPFDNVPVRFEAGS